MEIYGIGLGLEKGISQSNQSRYDLRQVQKKKAPLGNKLAPINVLDAKNKRGQIASLEYNSERQKLSLESRILNNKLGLGLAREEGKHV